MLFDPPAACWRLPMMLNPPGVKTIPTEIQNPPYKERTAAPKELPMAISLHSSAAIRERTCNKDARLRDIPHFYLNASEDEHGESECAEAQGCRVGELL
jgi:hypothetical protein